MEYRLNTFSEQYSEEQDITTIESICNYYGTLLKYLDVMLRTDNPTIFYMALKEAYTRVGEPGEFTNFISNALNVETKEIVTPIKKYKDAEIAKPYYEVWDIIDLKGTAKDKYDSDELVDTVNNRDIVVLERSKEKPVEEEYVNVFGDNVYYMGIRINKNKFPQNHLTPRPKFNSSSFYHIGNFIPAVIAIRETFFSKQRILNDIQNVSDLQTEYLRILKSSYKTLKK